MNPDEATTLSELEWSPEVQNVPVRIHDFEPPQLVRVVANRLPERNATGCELLGQRVRIRSINVRVPPGPVMPAGIRRRLHLRRDGLEHEPNAVALQHGEVRVILGAEKRYVEAETIFVERDGWHDIADNEARCDVAELCLAGWGRQWTAPLRVATDLK